MQYASLAALLLFHIYPARTWHQPGGILQPTKHSTTDRKFCNAFPAPASSSRNPIHTAWLRVQARRPSHSCFGRSWRGRPDSPASTPRLGPVILGDSLAQLQDEGSTSKIFPIELPGRNVVEAHWQGPSSAVLRQLEPQLAAVSRDSVWLSAQALARSLARSSCVSRSESAL